MGPFRPRPAGPASVIPVLAGLVRLALTGHGAEAELELTRLAVELTIPTGRGAVTGAPYELQVAANSFFTQPGFLRAWPDPTGTLLGSTHRLVAPEFPYQEDLYLAFPATGTSGEQAADGFFRVDTGLSDRWTDGFFEDADQRSGRVVAVWTRSAPSSGGWCGSEAPGREEIRGPGLPQGPARGKTTGPGPVRDLRPLTE